MLDLSEHVIDLKCIDFGRVLLKVRIHGLVDSLSISVYPVAELYEASLSIGPRFNPKTCCFLLMPEKGFFYQIQALFFFQRDHGAKLPNSAIITVTLRQCYGRFQKCYGIINFNNTN